MQTTTPISNDGAQTADKPTVASHWVGGRWRASARVGESTSPSTGEHLGSYADGGATEAGEAIAAARQAFDASSWSRDRSMRATALTELADRFDERSDELALTLSREMGKVIGQATLEAESAGGTVRANAAAAVSLSGHSAEVRPGVFFHSLPEPAGVAGIIVPWNAPIALLVRSLAPALAAGCTTVVKLPAQTAQTNALISEVLVATTALPAGVVNVFTESGSAGAQLLVASPDVEVISYTGSTQVGRIIAAAGAPTLKGMSLELGGKTPMIVFEDADLDVVTGQLALAMTMFSGQFCMAGSRILVQRTVADDLRQRLVEALPAVVVGPSDEPGSQMGPVIDQANVERIAQVVREAEDYATTLVAGGPITDGPLAKGSFFRPALLEVEDLDVPLVQQEVFGPVATFEIFDDEIDAIQRANATEFGLAAAIFTHDLDRARRVGRELRAGTVWTNAWALLNDQFEEGGFKQSGVGRLRGARGVEEFLEIKTYATIAPPVGAAS